MFRDIQNILNFCIVYRINHIKFSFKRIVILCPWIASFSKYSIDQFLSDKFSDEVNFSRIKLSRSPGIVVYFFLFNLITVIIYV